MDPHPPDPDYALSLRALTKRFGATIAADGLDLDVPRGSFYGLVGPNGAGKTTTLSMATGLLRPDAGSAHLLGVDVWADPVRAKALVGILPDGLRLFDRLTGEQLVTYSGLLRGMERDVVASRARARLEALGQGGGTRTQVGDYTTGMKKKFALATAHVFS
ncbi:MAG: ATP-binding cassette domain-containing protein, partial [Oryzihumus sp.]